MPRNRSEKLPACPASHAYADACEAVLNGTGGTHRSLTAWRALTVLRHKEINAAASTRSRNWRRKRITFIRKTYGA